MFLEEYLDQTIKNICPLQGISFGNLDDKSTWILHFDEKCTNDQKKLAIEFMDKFEWTGELQKQQDDLSKIAKYKNDLTMKQGYLNYLVNNPKARFLDYINYLETLNIE